MSAAAGAAEALKLLLEVCTVRSMDDPPRGRGDGGPGPRLRLARDRGRGIDALFARGPRRRHDHFPAGIAQNELAACRVHPPRTPT
jgi:hypothetical protein